MVLKILQRNFYSFGSSDRLTAFARQRLICKEPPGSLLLCEGPGARFRRLAVTFRRRKAVFVCRVCIQD